MGQPISQQDAFNTSTVVKQWLRGAIHECIDMASWSFSRAVLKSFSQERDDVTEHGGARQARAFAA
jgi:hypothetical protein